MVRYYGNWCGPNWTAGQAKSTAELTDSDRSVPAVDAFDQVCKDHDINIHDAQTDDDIQEANDIFMREARKYGIRGQVAAILVGLAGPSQPNLQRSDQMSPGRTTKRLRRTFDPDRVEREPANFDEVAVDTVAGAVRTGTELARQEEEDEGIRNVLLGNEASPPGRQGMDIGGRGLPISPAGRPQSNLPALPDFRDRSNPDEVSDYNNNTHRSSRTGASMDVPMADAPETTARSSAISSSRSGGFDARTVTPIAKIPPTFPYHNTEQAILEYHGSFSCNELSAYNNNGNIVKVRMNTYVLPFSETVGLATAVNQVDFTRPSGGISKQNIGRFCYVQGASGNMIDCNHHRTLSDFDDPLFADPAVTPFTLQKPAGAEYYKNHMKAYTVTKVEWMFRVTYPYHDVKGSDSTHQNPTAAEIQAALQASNMCGASTTPPSHQRPRIFTHYTTEGGTVTPINPPLDGTTLEMERWFNCYDNKVTVGVNQSQVIRGTWYPGMVKHNPLSDNDVEVWSPIDVVPPSTHLEHLIVQFRKGANSNESAKYRMCVNVNVDLKYHVQFKEPITDIQYPKRNQANPPNTAVNDRLLQVAPAYNV